MAFTVVEDLATWSGEPVVPCVDGYDDLVEIGRGGFGVVYRARQLELDRWVALKVLTGIVDEQVVRRFERERTALGALSGHPAIVTVHGSGRTATGLPYLAMELVAGGSLADRLRHDGPLAVATAVDLAIQVCGAVESAHLAGVLHRDIKPENVVVDHRGRATLVDFGMATGVTGATTSTAGVTATVGHAAPEVLVGDPATVRSDVYALGSTLFALLAGHAAFVRPSDESILAVLARIGVDPVPDLREHGVPADVAAVVERAMAKDPADRPASAAALAEALQAAQRRAGHPPTPLVVEHAGERALAAAAVPATPRPASTQVALGPPAPPATRFARTVLVELPSPAADADVDVASSSATPDDRAVDPRPALAPHVRLLRRAVRTTGRWDAPARRPDRPRAVPLARGVAAAILLVVPLVGTAVALAPGSTATPVVAAERADAPAPAPEAPAAAAVVVTRAAEPAAPAP